MAVFKRDITIRTTGSGTYEFTDQVAAVAAKSGIQDGITNVFCRHTSCSLVIMENADPSACRDLEAYLDRLVPERDPAYTHTSEGPDDMPSHIKMALTRTSEVIPVAGCRLQLGTWQGIFLWEHRKQHHDRRITISVVGN
ncbi:MAG: YjbQ family protein [Verrucomicrobia bacterium]|nr:MAG: YjbQ family protein [Verrucomicrobiota bacterium]